MRLVLARQPDRDLEPFAALFPPVDMNGNILQHGALRGSGAILEALSNWALTRVNRNRRVLEGRAPELVKS